MDISKDFDNLSETDKDQIFYNFTFIKAKEILDAIVDLCKSDKKNFENLEPFIKRNIQIMYNIKREYNILPDELFINSIPPMFHHLM